MNNKEQLKRFFEISGFSFWCVVGGVMWGTALAELIKHSLRCLGE